VTAKVSLALRASPAKSGRLLADLAEGEELELISQAGNWLQVKTKAGLEGWAFGKYLASVPPDRVRWH